MLKRDEEEILKVLLKLYEEQGSVKINGSYTDFPVKYQIFYKEILFRLQEQKFISDFEDVMAEDFLVTLLPPAISYFDDKTPVSKESIKVSKKPAVQSFSTVLDELNALIRMNGGKDSKILAEISIEIREFCQNLKAAPTVQPRKVLYGKISNYNAKYPWLEEKITKALGLAMLEIMAGK